MTIHNAETKKILITIKTYPSPSRKYKETVCTAGVLESGSFIRLYPIDFRYTDERIRFKKYQWIEVAVDKHPTDPRPESHRPYLNTLKILGKPLPTSRNWEERKKFVLKNKISCMCDLNDTKRTEVSLGIVKPKIIRKFYWNESSREWSGKQLEALNQTWLDGKHNKKLVKVPYEFRYKYTCAHPNCNGHDQHIIDWEVCRLFLKERQKKGEREALISVRDKFMNKLCGQDKDTYFFVGRTSGAYAPWVILGLFYPPAEAATQLHFDI